MLTEQIPGHLYGPPPPHIGFWYGDCYLGEVRGHPSDVPAAQTKLMRHIEMLGHGAWYCNEQGNRGRLVNFTRAMVYCGNFAIDVKDLHARERQIEAQKALALDRLIFSDFDKGACH